MSRQHPFSGDVYQVDLGGSKGSEPAFERPMIVLQAPELAQFVTTFLCIPTTTNLSRLGLPGTCLIEKGDGGMKADSLAICYQLRSIDRTRLRQKLGKISPETLQLLAVTAMAALGICMDS